MPSIRQQLNVSVLKSPEEIGEKLAPEILGRIAAASQSGRQFLLGCPSGRSLLSTYHEMSRVARRTAADLSNLVIVMMDDYVSRIARGYRYCPADAHYSCRRFAREDIVSTINAGRCWNECIDEENVWFPNPNDPQKFDARLRDAGGIDLFLLASGATDGHVAFNAPGSSATSHTRIVELTETTRRDNLSTFPKFRDLADVPTLGVSIGLGTMSELSHEVVMVMHGRDKAAAAAKLFEFNDFNTHWPASIVFRCRNTRILLDETANRRVVS